MSNYFEWKEFANVYLEDSYVLKINESEDDIIFQMDFVLMEKHSLFKSPRFNEQYCYHKGELIFSEIESKSWISKLDLIFYDANSGEDLGNVDVLKKIDGGRYKVSGDWGEIEITTAKVLINFE